MFLAQTPNDPNIMAQRAGLAVGPAAQSMPGAGMAPGPAPVQSPMSMPMGQPAVGGPGACSISVSCCHAPAPSSWWSDSGAIPHELGSDAAGPDFRAWPDAERATAELSAGGSFRRESARNPRQTT
ncbi:MAG: hypothetical protein WA172_14585 [Terriglobales bacterium]